MTYEAEIFNALNLRIAKFSAKKTDKKFLNLQIVKFNKRKYFEMDLNVVQ